MLSHLDEPVCPLRLGICGEPGQCQRHRFRLRLRERGDIGTGLSDGGQDFVRDPPLERLRLRLLRTEDDRIQPAFVHNGHTLLSTQGVHQMDILLVVP